MVTFTYVLCWIWIGLFWFAIQIATFGSTSGAIQSNIQIQDDDSLDLNAKICPVRHRLIKSSPKYRLDPKNTSPVEML
jgi:hypothetical protein